MTVAEPTPGGSEDRVDNACSSQGEDAGVGACTTCGGGGGGMGHNGEDGGLTYSTGGVETHLRQLFTKTALKHSET